MELLFEAGSNIDERNSTCQNILVHTILTEDCDENILTYLFAKVKEFNCEYMFHEPMRFNGFIFKVLYNFLKCYVYMYGSPDEIERPLMFLIYNGMGCTPIHAAFVMADMVAARMLINEGVDMFVKSDCGMTVLDYSKMSNQSFVMEKFFNKVLEDKKFQYKSLHCSTATENTGPVSSSTKEKDNEKNAEEVAENGRSRETTKNFLTKWFN